MFFIVKDLLVEQGILFFGVNLSQLHFLLLAYLRWWTPDNKLSGFTYLKLLRMCLIE
jgi:hypothetical protein